MELSYIDSVSERVTYNKERPISNKSFSAISQQILDNITLINLDIIPSGPDATAEGSLLERLDHCSTAFGM